MSRKPLEEMTQADVEEILGAGVPGDPDDPKWMSRQWKCAKCQTIRTFDVPVNDPAPCSKCGSIAFVIMASPTQ